VTNDSLPDNIKQALNDKSLAMKDLDTQIALENQKGSGIINPDGSVNSPINDEAMKRIAEMQAQKKALNEDKDLMSQIAAMAQQQGQPTPQAPDPAKAQAAIQSIVNPLGLTATPQANPTLNPLLTQSGAAGTPSGGTAAAASGGAAGGTTPTGGNTSKKVSSATSEKKSYEAKVKGSTGIESVKTSPTVITRSTDGADYQDTMPYSMGTLLAQQGYRDAISAGAGDAVGMQMNPFNAMLKEKMASIGNRNAAAALANKQNVDIKQGATEIKAGTGEADIREGYSSYSNVSMGDRTTNNNNSGSGSDKDTDTSLMGLRSDGSALNLKNSLTGNALNEDLELKVSDRFRRKNAVASLIAIAKGDKKAAQNEPLDERGFYKRDFNYVKKNIGTGVDKDGNVFLDGDHIGSYTSGDDNIRFLKGVNQNVITTLAASSSSNIGAASSANVDKKVQQEENRATNQSKLDISKELVTKSQNPKTKK
jgi:hypothetical protein